MGAEGFGRKGSGTCGWGGARDVGGVRDGGGGSWCKGDECGGKGWDGGRMMKQAEGVMWGVWLGVEEGWENVGVRGGEVGGCCIS